MSYQIDPKFTIRGASNQPSSFWAYYYSHPGKVKGRGTRLAVYLLAAALTLCTFGIAFFVHRLKSRGWVLVKERSSTQEKADGIFGKIINVPNLQNAAHREDMEAMRKLSYCYRYGLIGLKKDGKLAEHWMSRSEEKKNREDSKSLVTDRRIRNCFLVQNFQEYLSIMRALKDQADGGDRDALMKMIKLEKRVTDGSSPLELEENGKFFASYMLTALATHSTYAKEGAFDKEWKFFYAYWLFKENINKYNDALESITEGKRQEATELVAESNQIKEQAKKLLAESAHEGYELARLEFGKRFLESPELVEKALEYLRTLEKHAEDQEVQKQARILLAKYYLKKEKQIDTNQGVELLTDLVDEGYLPALELLGTFYLKKENSEHREEGIGYLMQVVKFTDSLVTRTAVVQQLYEEYVDTGKQEQNKVILGEKGTDKRREKVNEFIDLLKGLKWKGQKVSIVLNELRKSIGFSEKHRSLSGSFRQQDF